MSDHGVYETSNFQLQKGGALSIARLAYKTLGTLSPARDNAVLIPSWFSGTHREAELCMVGPGRAIDPARHYIILTNLLSGGVSSSPSNTPAPCEAARFPRVTLHDNVRVAAPVDHRASGHRPAEAGCWLVDGRLPGFSMGRAIPRHDGGPRPPLLLGQDRQLQQGVPAGPAGVPCNWTRRSKKGSTSVPPVAGLKAFAAIYAGWGFSEPFFREEAFRQFGAATPEEFTANFWDQGFLRHDANDLLTLLQTWYDGDISACEPYGGDYGAALAAIKARTVIMPGLYDRYFPPVDCEAAARQMPNAECRIIPSIWGHMTIWNPL